jgi:tRNA(Arg) A34 adenosine deaminase TadA
MIIALPLPRWLTAYEDFLGSRYPSPEARLVLAIELARHNVEHDSGGPFGAAIFERESGRLVSIGVNRVEAAHSCLAHAEIMAIGAAQRRLQTYNLAGPRGHELYSSAQPCMMCAGAVLWSGVSRLVYAATKGDVERIVGFDEGILASHWRSEFRRRGIEVQGGQQRKAACEVLRLYRARGGAIYSAHTK